MDLHVYQGDCRDAMAALELESVDAVVCDPPYGLEFMGKEWDGAKGFRRTLGEGQQAPPGIGDRATPWVSNQGWNQFRCAGCGHLSHGGSPCSCESPDFRRADDRWHLFQAWAEAWSRDILRVLKPGGHLLAFGGTRTFHRLTCAIEDAGFEIRDCLSWMYGSGFPKSKNLTDEWEGWGTALKPAWEPIIMARKPLGGTVTSNVLAFGTGALHINACRIGTESTTRTRAVADGSFGLINDDGWVSKPGTNGSESGRWPANVLLDEEAAAVLDAQAPTSTSKKGKPRGSAEPGSGWGMTATGAEYEDSGGPSRFFYCAKTPKKERNAGLPADGLNVHPTVKPVEVMRWLVRLVTPPGGLVFDPFMGSGTTGIACLHEGVRFIGAEQSPDYVKIALARLAHWRTELAVDAPGALTVLAPVAA